MQQTWKPKFTAGHGLEKALVATRTASPPAPIATPPSDVRLGLCQYSPANQQVTQLQETDFGGVGFTLSSFTASDAWELGHLLHARLLPFAPARPAVISISLASGMVLYQSATGPGTAPDNASWVARKTKTVMRFGVSSWFMGRKLYGDEAAFAAKFSLGERAGDYAIHGGGVPIRVHGVEGVVAVVVVSGLKQEEDHGVIAEVIRENWEPVW